MSCLQVLLCCWEHCSASQGALKSAAHTEASAWQIVGEWERCGSVYFTKQELYQMAWGEQDLSVKRCGCCAQ